jgi:hypothetical protein
LLLVLPFSIKLLCREIAKSLEKQNPLDGLSGSGIDGIFIYQ